MDIKHTMQNFLIMLNDFSSNATVALFNVFKCCRFSQTSVHIELAVLAKCKIFKICLTKFVPLFIAYFVCGY